MYQQMPQALTRRFEQIEGVSEDSLVLKHRSANLTVELRTTESGLEFLADLYAPLEGMTSPKEGIETLETLESQRVRLHLNGYEGEFGDCESGVEIAYKLGVESASDLQRSLREFSFINYKFVLDVDLEQHIDPTSRRFTGYIRDTEHKVLTSHEKREVVAKAVHVYLNRYATENPTARIGAYGVSGRHFTRVEFESEDEQTLAKTEADLRKILNDTHQREDLELVVTRKVRE